MINKLQLLSIKIINSKYRFFFLSGLYFIIYFLFYLDSIVFCMNEDVTVTSESWKELFYASQEKVRKLETKITSLKDENFDLSLENFTLQSQLEEKKSQISTFKNENLRLTNDIATEKNILSKTQDELSNTKKAYKILENQLQEYSNLRRQIRFELSESKTEINALKQKYETLERFQSENLNKKHRQI